MGCTPAPAVTPSPSPTASSATPTETAAERQERLDYAAAEKAYRTFRAEYGRVLRAGGAKEPTKVMKATAGGEYLATFTEVIRSYRDADSRTIGKESIGFVRPGGYATSKLTLDVCEDGRKVQTLIPRRKAQNGEIRTATIEVRQVGTSWKLWSGSGELADSCD
ncbi:hypothetical protein [Friedmanniella luteola]|uniref:hypothetical protein n=1 Tax=Friedmanniella luteola TaxID=546871 RepID=UPI0012FE2A2D|nr:hypothetical protein [Friedmanniella luteola]